MYWLAEICVRRPILALMIVASMVVAGLTAFPKLGVDRFPNVDLPTVTVRTSYPGAASVEVESEVTQIIEDAVATVAGIEELRSISSDGGSYVIITFGLSRSVDAAVQDVRDAVAGVSNRLPPNVDPPVISKSDLDSSPVMTLAVSGPRTPSELYYLADRFVKGIIESAQGVGEVSIAGAADRSIQVSVDAQRLAAYGITILQVKEALARQNAEVPGGRVDEGRRERSLRTLGRVADSRLFPQLVVDTIGETPIRLSDLGEVKDSTKEVRTLARLDGAPTVVLRIQRQAGENTVKVVEGIKERLARCESLLPDDVSVTVIQDQSRYILAALKEIEGHLISGSLLACLTVLLFMKSWRSTIIASVAIPTSIIATFAVMKLFGFTLNNVTMLALVLMVGVVIDDAIVVLENIFRCIEEKGMDPVEASIVGTREIGLAVLATTVSLVIVFLPVSFLASVTGRMLFEFGVTATAAILLSMVVSFTLTPMMCSRMLKPVKKNPDGSSPHSRSGFYRWIEASYLFCLRLSMRYRFLVLLLCAVVIYLNVPLYKQIKQDYIPTNVDESEFEVRVTAAEGANLVSMLEAIDLVEAEIAKVEGVEFQLTTVGSRGTGGLSNGEIYIRIKDAKERSFSFGRLWSACLAGSPRSAWEGNYTQQEKMAEIRKRLMKFPGIRASVRNMTSFRQGAPVDIDFSITGPDLERLNTFSQKLQVKAAEIPGVVDVDTTLRMDKPEMLANIQRERAASLGVSVQEIADTLRVAVGGDDRVSRYRDVTTDDAYDVSLRLVGIDRRDAESISQLYVRCNPQAAAVTPAGFSVPDTDRSLTRIDNMVSFEFSNAPARIDRLDRQRMVAVRANVGPGYALSDRIAAIHEAAAEIGLPDGFETHVLGRGKELERTLDEFRWTFVLSFVFMYIVLAAQFEHLSYPFTILLTLPLAVPFGLISLAWGGESLNVYSALGLLVLFGVVKKAAIMQVDHTSALRATGMDRAEAIIISNRDRLRPILMTTISFVAGLLPLLIASGPGAEERRSIAVLAVGGQTMSLLLTLLAVPVIYSYLDDLGRLFGFTGNSNTSPPAGKK